MRILLLILCFAFSLPLSAQSVPTFSQMAREIVCDCPSCGKQTLDQCHNGCARGGELSTVVKEQIKAGKSEAEILNFMGDTYGEQVLGVPRPTNFMGKIAPLMPFLILLFGLLPITYIMRTRHKKARLTGPKQAPREAPETDERLGEALKRFDY
jgi:cytochrome c-type biogenesis protein CcmH/NrfF